MGDILVVEPGAQSVSPDAIRLIPAVDTVPVEIAESPGYESVKRGIDVVVSVAALLLLLPVFGVIALLIKISSPGPVIFRQKRPGLNGVPFWIYKFRTMVPDAEAKLEQVHDVNNVVDPLIRVENDPRVTPLGRLLRKTSADELPQLVNVLRGEMSLVGPRPISRPIIDPRNTLRLKVLPGMTGLWQISGRKNGDTNYMLTKDMEYLQMRSLQTDARIVLGTVSAVLRANGAR
jgi:lipopolysaccharide/colanic/teichoic acid biosynthesis glycosyltransferase